MTHLIEILIRVVGAIAIITLLALTGVKLIELLLKQLRIYRILLQFIWHQKEFTEWYQTKYPQKKK